MDIHKCKQTRDQRRYASQYQHNPPKSRTSTRFRVLIPLHHREVLIYRSHGQFSLHVCPFVRVYLIIVIGTEVPSTVVNAVYKGFCLESRSVDVGVAKWHVAQAVNVISAQRA